MKNIYDLVITNTESAASPYSNDQSVTAG